MRDLGITPEDLRALNLIALELREIGARRRALAIRSRNTRLAHQRDDRIYKYCGCSYHVRKREHDAFTAYEEKHPPPPPLKIRERQEEYRRTMRAR